MPRAASAHPRQLRLSVHRSARRPVEGGSVRRLGSTVRPLACLLFGLACPWPRGGVRSLPFSPLLFPPHCSSAARTLPRWRPSLVFYGSQARGTVVAVGGPLFLWGDPRYGVPPAWCPPVQGEISAAAAGVPRSRCRWCTCSANTPVPFFFPRGGRSRALPLPISLCPVFGCLVGWSRSSDDLFVACCRASWGTFTSAATGGPLFVSALCQGPPAGPHCMCSPFSANLL